MSELFIYYILAGLVNAFKLLYLKVEGSWEEIIVISWIINELKRIDFFSDFFKPDTFKQFKKYIATGFMSFILEYLIFFMMYTGFGVWYIISNTVAYVIVFWFNFLLNRFWSFKSRDNVKRQLIIYSVLFIYNIMATNGMLYFLFEIAGVVPLISKVLVMGMVVSWNFIIYKKVIYR